MNSSLDDAGGGSARPLFTPHTAYRSSGVNTASPGFKARGGGAAASGDRGGVRIGTGVASTAGVGQYRLSMDNSPSFMSRSSANMSVAMSMGSDDDQMDGGGLGAGEEPGAEGGAVDDSLLEQSGVGGEESISDVLSP